MDSCWLYNRYIISPITVTLSVFDVPGFLSQGATHVSLEVLSSLYLSHNPANYTSLFPDFLHQDVPDNGEYKRMC